MYKLHFVGYSKGTPNDVRFFER